jgi:hypothetical protein
MSNELSLRHAGLLEQASKKLGWIHAMRRIVRTCVDATGFGMIVAEVARRGLDSGAGNFPSGMRGIVEFDWKGVQIYVAVRAVVGAETASDAPIFDDDFERVSTADGAHGAPDHAQRITALAAGSCHEIFVEAQALAHKAADSIVRVGASVHALIAAGAALQVEHEQTLSLHEAVGQELIDWQSLKLSSSAAIFGNTLVSDGLEFRPYVGETIEHEFKIRASNADDFDVIEGCTGGGSRASGEQGDLAKITAAREVRED